MVRMGTFRRDLLFRLRSITVDLPPLRERTGDIEIMTAYYLKKLSNRYGIKEKIISPDFMEVLTSYHWPGNVRELINALEKSISTAQGCSTLFSMHLPTDIRVHVVQSAVDPAGEYLDAQRFQAEDTKPFPNLKKLLASAERKSGRSFPPPKELVPP